MFKKKSSKFSVKSTYKSVDFEFQNSYQPENINIRWSRHRRATDSLKCGEAPIWNQTEEGDNGCIAGQFNYKVGCSPISVVTFHKDKKKGFESKVYRYTVESVNDSGRAKVLANADIDLASYGDLKGSTHYFALDMKPKQKFVLKAVLNVQVDFEFIKTANSKDPDMVSTWSKESESETPSMVEIENELIDSMYIDESSFSLAHQIQSLGDDVISPGAGGGDIFKDLPRCRLIILVFDGNWTEKSIVKSLNSFYNEVKLQFETSLEIFYVSVDQDRALIDDIQQEFLEFPVIKPSSQLSKVITEHYEVTKVPCLLVTSADIAVDELIGDEVILEVLMSSNPQKMVERWIKNSNFPSSIRMNSSYERISNRDRRVKTQKQRSMIPAILRKKNSTIDALEEKNEKLKSSIAELNLGNSQLQSKLERQTSLFGIAKRNETNLTLLNKILQAEIEIKGTLMKRGVAGPTGRFWRQRLFQCEDGKIIYFEPLKMEAKGFIEISEIVSIQKMPASQQDKNGASFTINVPGRAYEMQARDAFHMQKWIAAVRFLKENTILCEPIVEEIADQ